MAEDRTYQLSAPPVFVCGIQRSGTTLLVKMLSRHNAIKFLPQETHYFPLLWNSRDHLRRFGSPKALADLLRRQLPLVNYGWTTATEFMDALCSEIEGLSELPEDTAGLMRLTMHTWQQMHSGNIRTGEKTPAHIYYAPRILKEFPKCKFILMCRDPRAAALSEIVKLEGNSRTDRSFGAFTFIVRWATAAGLARQLSTYDNAILVRYEDLIADPAETLRKVCRFLDIDMTGSMLEVGVTNSSFSDKAQAGIGFNTENLERWKTELDPAIISLIEHHLSRDMEALSYKSSGIEADISGFPLIRQKGKLIAARKLCAFAPARFHHYNRNRKYRF